MNYSIPQLTLLLTCDCQRQCCASMLLHMWIGTKRIVKPSIAESDLCASLTYLGQWHCPSIDRLQKIKIIQCLCIIFGEVATIISTHTQASIWFSCNLDWYYIIYHNLVEKKIFTVHTKKLKHFSIGSIKSKQICDT